MKFLTSIFSYLGKRSTKAKPASKPTAKPSRIGAKATGSAAALAAIVAFVGTWEGLSTTAYKDIVGVWTVCYGETRGVTSADAHTVAECDAMLAKGLQQFEAKLDACLTREDEMPLEMKIALVSWAYNIGTGAACSSTLVRLANAGDFRGACEQLPRWNKAGGQAVKGLSNRRGAERAMCLQGVNA